MRCKLLLLILVSFGAAAAPPMVTRVKVDGVTHTGARIQWQTSVPTTGDVTQYDPVARTPPFANQTVARTSTSTIHGNWIGGLAPATTYYYRVCSTIDKTQTCSEPSSFTTAAEPANRFSPPALPQPVRMPPLPTKYGETYAVDPNCSNLQLQLNAAAANQHAYDVVVSIPAAAVCSGNYQLPARSCTTCGWIVVRSAAPDIGLPPEGVRTDPVLWGPNMPTLTGMGNAATLDFGDKGKKWRFVGLQIKHGSTAPVVSMVRMAPDSARDIIFDRCIFDETVASGNPMVITLWGDDLAVVNSYIYNMTKSGLPFGVDVSQSHRVLVSNTYLNAPGISSFAQAMDGTNGTTDYTFTRNLLEWSASDNIPSLGSRQQFELKTGIRVLVDGNIFRNQWAGGLVGGVNSTITLTVRASDFGARFDSTNEISDFTFTNNTLQNVPGGIQITGGETSQVASEALGTHRLSIVNNLFRGIDGNTHVKPPVRVLGVPFDLAGGIEDLTIDHNTVWDNRGARPFIFLFQNNPMGGLRVRHNVFSMNLRPPVDRSSLVKIFEGFVKQTPRPDPSADFSDNLIVPGVTDTSDPANYSKPDKRYDLSDCKQAWKGFKAVFCVGSGNTANAGFNSPLLRSFSDADAPRAADHRYEKPSDGLPYGADLEKISVAQGLVPDRSISVEGSTLKYETRDTSMQCFIDFGHGQSFDTRTADRPGQRFRSFSLPSGTHLYRLMCAGGIKTDGAPAVFAGTM